MIGVGHPFNILINPSRENTSTLYDKNVSINITAEKSKIVRIKNTLRLDTVEVSEPYAEMLPQRPDLEIISGPNAMVFDDDNNYPEMFVRNP